VAFSVALVAALAAGLWLGGHPRDLPGFLRDRFVAKPAALTSEAAEIIQDNYYRSVGNTELENSSLQGMVHELRKRHGDRFSDSNRYSFTYSLHRSRCPGPNRHRYRVLFMQRPIEQVTCKRRFRHQRST